jgi:hypothetical protein
LIEIKAGSGGGGGLTPRVPFCKNRNPQLQIILN